MRKIFTIFHKEFVSMHEAAFLLGIFAFLSQLLALARDRLLAHIFGASQDLDIYYAAFRIPDFLFVSLASLAGAYVLIPFLLRKKEEGKDEAKQFLSNIFTVLFFLMGSVALLLYAVMPTLSDFVVPGFSVEAREEFIFLSRILLFSPFLLGFSNLLGSVTQASRKFFVFAVGPLVYNLGIITGILFLAPKLGIRGIAVGVVIGASLHLFVQLPAVMKEGLLPRFSKIRFREAVRVFSVSFPRTIALSSNHFSLLALAALASMVSSGSISIFQFAFNLQSVPLSIIGVSYSVAAFPTLAKAFGSGDKQQFIDQISTAARHIIFWSVPLTALFIVLRAQIVRVILGSGAFNWEHTRLTAASLAVFSLSLLAQNLVLLFARGYYAAGHTRRPLLINLASSLLIVVLGFFFFSTVQSSSVFRENIETLLRIEGLGGSAVTVLPLAFALGTLVNAFLLWRFFQKDFGGFTAKISRSFWESIGASCALSFTAWVSLNIFNGILNINTFWGIFMQGFLSGLLGIIAGIFVLILLKNPELHDTVFILRRKFWKTRPVVPEQEEL